MGEVRAGPGMQCRPSLPRETPGEVGGGYTEQLRLQTVLKTGSAHQFQHLQNTCKDKSEFWTQSFCLPVGGVHF